MIVKTEGVCGGSARIATTRIPVWQVLLSLGDKPSARDVMKFAASHRLTTAEVFHALVYALKCRAEIDKDIAENGGLD